MTTRPVTDADLVVLKSLVELRKLELVGNDGMSGECLVAVSDMPHLERLSLFGSGVDDGHTVASHLQSLVGDSYQVINAGVGGYSGLQAFGVARKMAELERYDVLIYAAHHNDFFESRHIASSELAEDILGRFAELKGEFPKGVIVTLVTYLNYAARETLLQQGWRQERIDATDELRKNLPGIAAAAGFEFIDFTNTIEDLVQPDGTVFAPFALYCDRAHLSPRGNRLLAGRIFETLRRMTDRGGANQAARR